MLSQKYASIGSFLPQPMKQRSLNYQNLLQLLWKSILCSLFFQMIEINYVPIYMKINHIFFVIKGQFPVQYNNIVIHCTLYLCIMCILLHNMFALISYATSEWPEVLSFHYIMFCSLEILATIWIFWKF